MNYKDASKKLNDLLSGKDFTLPNRFGKYSGRRAQIAHVYMINKGDIPVHISFNVYRKDGEGFLDRGPSILRNIINIEPVLDSIV